jgi:hypothetical protein
LPGDPCVAAVEDQRRGQPDFGAEATTSADLVVDGYGDGAGYHLQVATAKSALTWSEAAIIHPAGLDAQSWHGYQCVFAADHHVDRRFDISG